MKKVILIFGALMFSSFLYGEAIDIDSCFAEALQKSNVIKSREMAIKASSSDSRSAFYNFFPTAKIAYKYMKVEYYKKPGPIILPISDPPVEFEIPLPEWQNALEVSIMQPITPLWSVDKGYTAKKLVTEIERLRLTSDSNQLRANIVEFYNSYFMLEEASELIDETDLYLKKYKQIAENFIAEEMSDKRAALKIDIELERVEKEKQNILGNQSVIKTAIALLLDRDENSFTLKPGEKKSVHISKSYEELLEIQESMRPEIKMLKKSDIIAEKVRDTNYLPFIPTVALVAGYNNDFSHSDYSPEGSFYVGGAAEWGIGFDFFSNYHKFGKADAEMIKTKLDNAESKKQMTLQIKSLYSSILVKESEIKLSEKEIIEAKENLRIEENKYKEKMTTEADLLSALLSFKRAATSAITAYYNHNTAINSLSGILGVKVDDITNSEQEKEK
ncbi:MAG TPA: TolC family protein [bacterium]|nr:TolC family protein [bacterium]